MFYQPRVATKPEANEEPSLQSHSEMRPSLEGVDPVTEAVQWGGKRNG